MLKFASRVMAVIFLLITFLVAPIPAYALTGVGEALGLDPSWNWRTLETEHFRVTFPAELEVTANRAANLFEEAHSLLSPKLLWSPMHRTQILVVDNTDLANGLTSPVLRFGIVLMVTPPEDWYSTSYYDDWLRLLVLHEYTHFLNMDVTQDLWTNLRYVFGDLLLPNAILPPWMLEGLAVYMETRLTRAGRGRSPFYDMIIRSNLNLNLDQLNGPNPYFPGGETHYLFGYELMNQVASGAKPGVAADGKDPVRSGDDAVGLLSYRSGGRVPLFINGNLENVVGKSWYQIWDDWQTETKQRISADLEKIRSQPLSEAELLTHDNFETFGSALSPDGKWLAYTADSSGRRMGLYLREIQSGNTRRLMDKSFGTAISFSPDSSTIFLSAVERTSNFTTFSDLKAYNLLQDKVYNLSNGLRARDPSVSRDGQWIVFTLTQDESTGLAIAPLTLREGRFELGAVERVYMPARYDRISNPVFSKPDGSVVVFSLHTNGQASQEIMQFERSSGKVSVLIKNGKFNRQPCVSPNNEIYFISDLTGVDNLYRYRNELAPELVSNVITGLAFPSFSPAEAADASQFHAAYFSGRGWDLARFKLLSNGDIPKLTLPGPPAPEFVAGESQIKDTRFDSKEYSIFPSILPRQWLPLLSVDANRAYIGAEILGFDAVDQHRYLLGIAYDTLVKKPDWLLSYTNRSFWPTLTASVENSTNSVTGLMNYSRRTRFEFDLSRAWLKTYSVFNTILAFRADRTLVYDLTTANDVFLFSRPYTPNADIRVEYADLETSRLAIVPEAGRTLTLAARAYFNDNATSWKALYIARQYLRVSEHSVLQPKLKGSWTSGLNLFYLPANVILEGSTASLTKGIADDSLDQLGIRGYPLTAFYARGANVVSLDYFFPLARIFRGLGTAPVFFENFYGFIFGENSFVTLDGIPTRSLPSAGGGVKVTSKLFFEIPLGLIIEYDYGFRKQSRGTGELFAVINAGTLSF